MKILKNQSGFTLLELIFVIFILAVLAAIAIPNYTHSRDKAKIAAAKESLNTIIKGINMYYIDFGNYPSDSTLSNMSSISVLSEELANQDVYLNQFYDSKIQEYKSPSATPGDSSPFEILIRTNAGVSSDGKVCWLYYSEARDVNEIWINP